MHPVINQFLDETDGHKRVILALRPVSLRQIKYYVGTVEIARCLIGDSKALRDEPRGCEKQMKKAAKKGGVKKMRGNPLATATAACQHTTCVFINTEFRFSARCLYKT
jgi:hypothetical protein